MSKLFTILVAAAMVALTACKWIHDKKGSSAQNTTDPIAAIANLSDPQKLKTIKPESRAVNGRVDKILYFLHMADEKGIPPTKAIEQAFTKNHCLEPRRSLARKQLEINYRNAKQWGLFAPESLDRLKRGNAGLITQGSYKGQLAEVDHIVPLARYPQFGNELANLQLMPARQNRSKSDRMGAVELEKLKQLQALLSPTPAPRAR